MPKYERGFGVDSAVPHLSMRDRNNFASGCRERARPTRNTNARVRN